MKDGIEERINLEGLDRLKRIAETFGWKVGANEDGFLIRKEIRGVSWPVYIIIDDDSLDREIPLCKIIRNSIDTFHSVAAACEMALDDGDTNLYQFEEVEAVKKFSSYLNSMVTVKAEMVGIYKAVRDCGVEIIQKKRRSK